MAEKEEQRDPFGRAWQLKAADDLVQEDVAGWNRAYVLLKPVGLAEQREAALKAAIVAGWILSPATAAERTFDLAGGSRMVYSFDGVEVGKMKPAEVMWYGRECDRLYAKATTVPDSKN